MEHYLWIIFKKFILHTFKRKFFYGYKLVSGANKWSELKRLNDWKDWMIERLNDWKSYKAL